MGTEQKLESPPSQRPGLRTEIKTKMNKRKHSQLEAGDGWLARKEAQAMCERKLKRMSSSTLYKTVLVKNTLKFVQNSQEENILFGDEESYQPARKMKYYEEEALIHDVNEILNEMIFPQSFLPSPEEMALDWPEPPEELDVSLVPQVDIIEKEADEEFLQTILCDRTNVTITKISDTQCLASSGKNHNSSAPPQYSRYPGYHHTDSRMIKPEITLIPAAPLLKCL